jgi:hypothetical protein
LLALGVLTLLLGATIAAWAELSVSRHTFARGVEAREPVDAAAVFPADVGVVYFFTQIVGATGPTELRHVWIYDGKEMASVPLSVGGSGWRTWSSKRILSQYIGDWTVEVRDALDTVVLSATCRIE